MIPLVTKFSIQQEENIGTYCNRQLPRGGPEGGLNESMLGESTLTMTSSPTDSSLESSSSPTALRCRPSARGGGKGASAGAIAGAGADFLFIALEPSDLTDNRGRVSAALEGTFGYDTLCFWFPST